jgi:hypothetical protein
LVFWPIIYDKIFEKVVACLSIFSSSGHSWRNLFCLKILFFLSINQPELAEATEYLIQTFYGFEAALIKVTCQIEVSEQYHVYLQTRQQSKDMCIASIEQYTNTIIQFPTIITNGYGRRTSVIITGSPTQVCQARKLFDVEIYAFN